MKISSKASRYISSRRGETRFAPYSLKNKFGDSDQMYIDNAQSKKRLNKPGSSTVGGKANNRFQDLDYSYERMQMSDRLLDMNPAPPPYSDTLIRWDLDVNPQVPVPQFTYDAYEDPDNDKPEDEPKDEDENEEEQPPKEMTKEEWEAAFKNNDKGTYDLYLYTNYYLYTDGKYHVMDAGTYDFFSKYMHFEYNITYENPWFNKDTQFKLVEFKNEEEGIVYMQFYFIKDGNDYYFSMPVDTYDPRNNEGSTDGTKEPYPDKDPESQQSDALKTWEDTYKVDDRTYYYPEGIFEKNFQGSFVLNDEQWNWLRMLIQSQGETGWILPSRNTSIFVDTKTSNYINFGYGDPQMGTFKVFNTFVIPESGLREPQLTEEQQFNIEKGLFMGQYMDPATGAFTLPINLGLDSELFFKFLNDYIRFFSPSSATLSFGSSKLLSISYLPGVSRVEYQNPPSKSKLYIDIPRNNQY